MEITLRDYLKHLKIEYKQSDNIRTCPQCNKQHSEIRINRESLAQTFGTVSNYCRIADDYKSSYTNWCFACIQTELLLPS